jgi:hypothetical protein
MFGILACVRLKLCRAKDGYIIAGEFPNVMGCSTYLAREFSPGFPKPGFPKSGFPWIGFSIMIVG